MNRAHRFGAAGLLAITMLLTSCVKPNTFDPYANPGHDELDRLQTIVNQRPGLETVQQQLANLDTTIRSAIAKYSPQTRFTNLKLGHPP
ncbi:LppA family lipoprotein, partial [Mycobacterium kansasii]